MMYTKCVPFLAWALALSLPLQCLSVPLVERDSCQKTEVLILGAGVAGITAAQALSNRSVTDFVIVEYNDVVGGRVRHTTFGAGGGGSHVIELGANWVQGTERKGGFENPIWRLAKKYNIQNTYSNYGSLKTYNETGASDFKPLFRQFSRAYGKFEREAGVLLTRNLQDRNANSGLSLAGWEAGSNTGAQAIEWFNWDFEYAWPPNQSSMLFGVVNYNTTFYRFSERNNYVIDPRGFNAFIKGESRTFLKRNDPRLRLNTVVTKISYSDDSVTVRNSDGSCITASYAICTFSVGVLQYAISPTQGAKPDLTFDPPLPDWKQQSLATFQMGTYTKIFLQFEPEAQFWPDDTQFFLYASPTGRGYYPGWQSLTAPGFLPGSGIFFVTVVEPQSQIVEAQDDETTKQQVLEVLRNMFGAENVPEPTAFLYPRWTQEPWARGSYSNWPPGTTLEQHQNLRANVGRLWFAGEATSASYYGFLHGAWTEGRDAGKDIARCLQGKGPCNNGRQYDVLHGRTREQEYNKRNGWLVTSFYD